MPSLPRRHLPAPRTSKPDVPVRASTTRPTDDDAPRAGSRFDVCIDDRCPIEDTLDIIAGRWKILVLWWLQTGELRFGELRRRIPSVTPKVLTQQLRQLEAADLVSRTVFAEVPPKVVYALTARGRSLQPVLQSLSDWSRRN